MAIGGALGFKISEWSPSFPADVKDLDPAHGVSDVIVLSSLSLILAVEEKRVTSMAFIGEY